jgi:hypothetical protein
MPASRSRAPSRSMSFWTICHRVAAAGRNRPHRLARVAGQCKRCASPFASRSACRQGRFGLRNLAIPLPPLVNRPSPGIPRQCPARHEDQQQRESDDPAGKRRGLLRPPGSLPAQIGAGSAAWSRHLVTFTDRPGNSSCALPEDAAAFFALPGARANSSLGGFPISFAT